MARSDGTGEQHMGQEEDYDFKLVPEKEDSCLRGKNLQQNLLQWCETKTRQWRWYARTTLFLLLLLLLYEVYSM